MHVRGHCNHALLLPPSRTCRSPSASMIRQILSSSLVPNTSTRSSCLASVPLLTLLNTVVACKTSSMSFSLQSMQYLTSRDHCFVQWCRKRTKQSLHAISPVQNLVLVAGHLKPLALLFIPYDCDICQSLLTCTTTSSTRHFALGESWHIAGGGRRRSKGKH